MNAERVAAVALLTMVTIAAPVHAQRSGVRGPNGMAARSTDSHAGSQPARTAESQRARGSIRYPVGPRPVLGGTLPMTWWWFTDVNMPYPIVLETRDESAAPPRPTPQAESSLILPMPAVAKPSTSATTRGTVQVDVTPPSAQAYVDGFYIGTVEQIRSGLELAAGWHRLEFRAPGYATIAANVTVEAHRSISYHAQLNALK